MSGISSTNIDRLNKSDYAEGVRIATSIIVDALSLAPGDRRSRFTRAQMILWKACERAADENELALATALVQVVKDLERRGADR